MSYMNTKLKNMLDICEYLVHDLMRTGHRFKLHEGQLALQCFRLHGHSQSGVTKKHTDRVKH